MKNILVLFLGTALIMSAPLESHAGILGKGADILKGLDTYFGGGKKTADEVAEGTTKPSAPSVKPRKDDGALTVGPDGKPVDPSESTITLDSIATRIEPNPSVKGMDSFIRTLSEVLMRTKKAAAILVAPAGTGKSAAAEYLVHLIQTRSRIVRNLHDHTVYNIDVTKITGGTKFSGDLEKNFALFRGLLKDLKDDKVVFVIDELEEVLKSENGLKFLTDLKSYMTQEMGVKLIFNITPGPYDELMKDPQLIRRMFKLVNDEPDDFIVKTIGKQLSIGLEEKHGIKMSAEQRKQIFELSKRHPELKNPDVLITMMEDSVLKAVADASNGNARVTQMVTDIEKIQGTIDDIEDGIREGIAKYESPFHKNLLDEAYVKRDKFQAIVNRYQEAFNKTEESRAKMLKLIEQRKELYKKVFSDQSNDNLGDLSIDAQIEPLTDQINELASEIKSHGDFLTTTELKDEHIVKAAAALLNKAETHVKEVMNGGRTSKSLIDKLAKGIAIRSEAIKSVITRATSRTRISGSKGKLRSYLVVGDDMNEIKRFGDNFSQEYYGISSLDMNFSEFQSAGDMTAIRGAGPSYAGYGEETEFMEMLRLTSGDVLVSGSNITLAGRELQKFLLQFIRTGIFKSADKKTIEASRATVMLRSAGVKPLKPGQNSHLGKLKSVAEKQAYLKKIIREQIGSKPEMFGESQFIDNELLDEVFVIFAHSDSTIEANLKAIHVEKLRSATLKKAIANNIEMGIDFDDALSDRLFEIVQQVGIDKLDDIISDEIYPAINEMIERGILVNGDNIVLSIDENRRIIVGTIEDWSSPEIRDQAIRDVLARFSRADGAADDADDIDKALDEAKEFFGE